MQLSSAVLLLAVSLQGALASPGEDNWHTTCYNYFLGKDNCVFASTDDGARCPAEPKCPPQDVYRVTGPPSTPPTSGGRGYRMDPPPHQLVKRYDTTQPSSALCNGAGICGPYDTNRDHGACLWAGANAKCSDPAAAGWLNSAQSANCGKRLYVQRKGDPSSVVFVPVIDGCTFETSDKEVGCFQIALTNKTFHALNPTCDETNEQVINDLIWDFDNLHGASPQQGPI